MNTKNQIQYTLNTYCDKRTRRNKKIVEPTNKRDLNKKDIPFWEAEFLENTGIVYRYILKAYVRNLSFFNTSNWKNKIDLSKIQADLTNKFNELLPILDHEIVDYNNDVECPYGLNEYGTAGLDLKIASKAKVFGKSIFRVTFDIHIYQASDTTSVCKNEQDALKIITNCLKKIPNGYVTQLGELLENHDCKNRHSQLTQKMLQSKQDVPEVKKSVSNEKIPLEKKSEEQDDFSDKTTHVYSVVKEEKKENRSEEKIHSSPISQPSSATENNVNTTNNENVQHDSISWMNNLSINTT